MKALAADKKVIQLVTFRLGEEEYGVDILKVHEINRMMDITSVPNAPDCIEGVINLRGKVIPVINLRKKFGLPHRQADARSKIVVVDVGKAAGIIVDSVSEVLRIASDVIEPPPPMTASIGSEYILGVGKLKDRLLILLDIGRLLGAAEGDMMVKAIAS
ncbi:MAG: chemotaxis protein CheW [Desulfobacteria bacterium]|nr:chemotaxis protein CheW [Deltaproteobacteria bacterium]